MTKTTQPKQAAPDVPPTSIPDVTPARDSGPDYGLHVLQAVMEMQRTLGALTAKVDRLVEDVGKQGERLDGMRLKMALVAGGGAAIGAAIGALIAILNAIPWDRVFPPA